MKDNIDKVLQRLSPKEFWCTTTKIQIVFALVIGKGGLLQISSLEIANFFFTKKEIHMWQWI